MSILDYRDQLEIIEEKPTYLICRCPNCKENRLKISKRDICYGAYKCWSGCTTDEVRSSLDFSNTKNSYLSPYRKQVPQSIYSTNLKIENAKQVEFQGTKLIPVPSPFEPITSSTRRFVDCEKKITIYPYSDTQRVYRLDSESGKEIYLQHKNSEGIWEAGTGNHPWPIYSRGLDFTPPLDGDTIIFVEGEKTAEYVKSLGYACITASSVAFNKEGLYKAFYLFLKKTQTKNLNFLILPDDDTPGYKKATLVSQTLNYLKVANKILTISEMASLFNVSFEANKGVDIADFDKSKVDLLMIL